MIKDFYFSLNFNMKSIDELIEKLNLFSNELIEFNGPISAEEIAATEKAIGYVLPMDYKAFLSIHNGIALMGVTIYGIKDRYNQFSLLDAYYYEHESVGNVMFKYLIPFSPDGLGNHYCFDARTNNTFSCEIKFWQHDIIYNELIQPEKVNSSFSEWVEEVLIDWTLGDYDFKGNPK
jgi:cell wall assembly regulator SMI1